MRESANKAKLHALIHWIERWFIFFTLRKAAMSEYVHLKYRKGEFWWEEDNIKMNFGQ